MKNLLKSAALMSSALFIFSCGGGGSDSGSTTTTTLTGQFVDAPVAGLQYTTSSGLTGTTDENGYFKYRAGDTVTFKLGKIILGDAKGNDVVTPTALFVDETTDPTQLQQKVKTVVALLLALDENPDDDKITISETVIQQLDNLTTEKNIEEEDSPDFTDVSVDIDGDGQKENLDTEVENKKTEAENHYDQTLYSLLINALNKFNGKDFYFTNDNPPVRCTLQYSGGNQFSFHCPERPEKNDTVTISQNPLRLTSSDGIEHYVISADDDEICVYWEENQTTKTTCLKLWEDEKNYEPNVVDITDTIRGTVLNLQNPAEYKIRITPKVEQVEGEWGGVVCQINSDGSFGNQCFVHGNLANYTTSTTYQVIIFKDINDDWHFNPDEESEAVYGAENVTFDSLTNIQIDVNNSENPPSDNYAIDITSFENFLQSIDGKRLFITSSDYDEQNQITVQEVYTCVVNPDLQNKQINFTDCYGDEANPDFSLVYWEENGYVYLRGADENSTVKNPLFILNSKIACIKEFISDNEYHLSCIFNVDNPIIKQSQQDVKNAVLGLWKRYKVENNNEFSTLVDNGACIRFNSNNTLDYITQNNTESLNYQIQFYNMLNYGAINVVTVSTTDEDIYLFPLYKDSSGNLMMFNIWYNKNRSLDDADVRLFKPVDSCF